MNNNIYYKLTNKNEVHHDLQYTDGPIKDPLSFNPIGKCQAGGLYFFSMPQLANWGNYVSDYYWIRKVTIPETAEVYHEDGKAKPTAYFYILVKYSNPMCYKSISTLMMK